MVMDAGRCPGVGNVGSGLGADGESFWLTGTSETHSVTAYSKRQAHSGNHAASEAFRAIDYAASSASPPIVAVGSSGTAHSEPVAVVLIRWKTMVLRSQGYAATCLEQNLISSNL